MSDTASERAGRARKAQEAVSEPGAGPPATRLTSADRRLVTRARELAAAGSADELAVIAGRPGESSEMVRAAALGTAQYLLNELADLAERLGGHD